MGFKRCALNLAGLVGLLDDGIGFTEAFLQRAYAAVGTGCDVVSDVSMERELVNYLSIPLIILFILLIEICGSSDDVLDLTVVDEGCALGHCLFHRQYGSQGLVSDLYEGLGLLAGFPILCHDRSNAVADMAYLTVDELPVMGAGFGVALTGRHVVDVGNVFPSDDGLDALKLFGFTGVDVRNIGHGIGASEDLKGVCSGHYLILNEDLLTADQAVTINLAGRLSDHIQFWTE